MRTNPCSTCGGSVVEITLTAESGPLTLISCSACEQRAWRGADGAAVPMDDVLAEMARLGGRRRARAHRVG